MSAKSFTERQGQYLAFIDAYTRVHGRPPAETDMQRHFQLSPPSVHQMVLTLERLGHTAASQASRAASRCSSLPKICPFSVTPNPSNPLCRGSSAIFRITLQRLPSRGRPCSGPCIIKASQGGHCFRSVI